MLLTEKSIESGKGTKCNTGSTNLLRDIVIELLPGRIALPEGLTFGHPFSIPQFKNEGIVVA